MFDVGPVAAAKRSYPSFHTLVNGSSVIGPVRLIADHLQVDFVTNRACRGALAGDVVEKAGPHQAADRRRLEPHAGFVRQSAGPGKLRFVSTSVPRN